MSQIPPPLPTPTLAYATPVEPLANAAWRRAGQLIVPVRSQLPPVCVKCNAPEAKRYTNDVYWHEPWVYVLILPGILIYAIVSLAIRKKATYECGLCTTHARRRLRHILVIWIFVGFGALIAVLGGMAAADVFGRENDQFALLIPGGLFVIVGAGVYAVMALPILRPKKIDDQYAYLTGAHPSFLDQLPEA